MSIRACLEIGGTFTDLVLLDEKGTLKTYKSSTVPGDLTRGALDVFQLAAEDFGMKLKHLLGECVSLTYGTTIATNAIIQGHGAKTGLICTDGFREILSVREGGKEQPFDLYVDYPEPYVPRYLTLPVRERINSEGEVVISLVEDDVVKAVNQFRQWKIEVIAVSLLWSIMNPSHEKRIGELIEQEWPGIPYILSHQTVPIIREYRRTSGTAIAGSIIPMVGDHIRNFEGRLRDSGFQGELLMVNAAGGLMPPLEMMRNPLLCIDSGPAMAPVAGRMFGAEELHETSVMMLDMGGTSLDVSLVNNGRVSVSREAKVSGHALGITKMDTRCIGAGGGSIAWLDPGNFVHVGPQSSGADPGPVCYKRGGNEPTVTDACAVLGYLDAGYFLGGKMEIDPSLSKEAIQEKIAGPLNLDPYEAASTICEVVEQNMIAAIEDITIWQGIEPKEYVIVCGGGAIGLHIGHIARELGIRKVLVPRMSGTISAMGGICAEILSTFNEAFFTESGSFNYEVVHAKLEKIEKESEAFLSRCKVAPKDRKVDFFIEARYPCQVWDLEVPLNGNRIANENDVAQLVADFHDIHERVFAVKEPGQKVECTGCFAEARGKAPEVRLEEKKAGIEDPAHALVGKRPAYFRELGGLVETPVYRGEMLMCNNKIAAPAIIEEPLSTLVVFPGTEVTVTRWGSYLIEIL